MSERKRKSTKGGKKAMTANTVSAAGHKRMNVWVPPDVEEFAREYASHTDRSLAQTLRVILRLGKETLRRQGGDQ